MSEHAVATDPHAGGGGRGKGKQVRATDMLRGIGEVPTEPVERRPVPERIDETVGEGSASHEPSPATRPSTTPTPPTPPTPAAESPAVPAPWQGRRPKPTALKLPAGLTDELRAAMVYLRAHGAWDASMSKIAQAGIRHELDRLKAAHGLSAFPPVPESKATRGK